MRRRTAPRRDREGKGESHGRYEARTSRPGIKMAQVQPGRLTGQDRTGGSRGCSSPAHTKQPVAGQFREIFRAITPVSCLAAAQSSTVFRGHSLYHRPSVRWWGLLAVKNRVPGAEAVGTPGPARVQTTRKSYARQITPLRTKYLSIACYQPVCAWPW